jgi:hypothetical protein
MVFLDDTCAYNAHSQSGAMAEHEHAHHAQTFAPPATLQANAHVKSFEEYRALYEQSISDPVCV